MTMAAFDPNKMASFSGDEDPASPTTIIFKQMQAAGIPLSAGNIRQFMEQKRSSPAQPEGQFDIEQGGQGQRTAQLKIERGSDDTAGKIEGSAPPASRSSDVSGPGAVNPANTTTEDKNTSSQPAPSEDPAIGATAGGTGSTGNLGAMIATGLGLGGAGALGMRAINSGLIPGASAGPPPAIVPPVAPPAEPMLSPMESAMLKATAPANDRLGLGATVPDVSGGVPTDPAAAALGNLYENRIQTGIQEPPNMPPQIPEIPFRSNPASRVPNADITVRPRIPIRTRGLHLS